MKTNIINLTIQRKIVHSPFGAKHVIYIKNEFEITELL